MIAVRLSEASEKLLKELAQTTDRSRSYYIRKAVDEFLEEKADYLMALAASENIRQGKEKTYTLEEVEAMIKAHHG